MVKPEWGTKRICPNCGARYYDLHHDPIVCPKCGANFDPEALLKTRRVRVAAAPVEDVAEPAPDEELEPELEAETAEGEEEEETATEGGEEEEEEEVLEDASELGEDEDDMAEVIENVDDEEER